MTDLNDISLFLLSVCCLSFIGGGGGGGVIEVEEI